jgi:hypothetical protein
MCSLILIDYVLVICIKMILQDPYIHQNIIKMVFVQRVSTPMGPSKFVDLKRLSIIFDGVSFDYLSLITFLNASPSLETLTLSVSVSNYPSHRYFRN